MRVFFGGQIKKECRGNLATVVSRQGTGQEKSPWYDVFVYPIDSEEFVSLTGVREVNNPIERVYIRVSHKTGGEIANLVNGRHIDAIDLKIIDSWVVLPHFLDKYLDKPSRVVLESTPNGYKVVEAK